MIDRYTRPEMGHIFSLENKYAIWQEIEVLACEAQAELGKIGISKEEAQWIRDHANFEKAKVDEIEEVTRHDVIAFLTNMKEYIDADVPEGDPKQHALCRPYSWHPRRADDLRYEVWLLGLGAQARSGPS